MRMNTARYVVDLMTPNPVVVGAAASAWSAECLAEERNVHHLIVMDHYELVGEVCRCDLRTARAEDPVVRCMHSPPVTIDDQQTADAALGIMSECGVGCLPVVDWMGTLHGIITRSDLCRAGLVRAEAGRACAACGSTHGLCRDQGDGIVFCERCVERVKGENAPLELFYFIEGGGD
jgi:acetoin utilization protein AcuB